MLLTSIPIKDSLLRQANHWYQAASRLSVLDNLASLNAWQGIDHRMATSLKDGLQESINEIVQLAQNLTNEISRASDPSAFRVHKRSLVQLRDRYLKTEETIHFYTVAINSRTTPGVAALLRACDILCVQSMRDLLQHLDLETPPVLTYVEKGVGASILKAGLRLWDGKVSKVAAIKVTQHNLFRPTAIIHETGHQIAHMISWTEELGEALLNGLGNHPPAVARAFASWSSEMAADSFAFVHTGYASVAALHDVVSGMPQAVFAYHVNDPHPISYIRVLLNIEMCRQFYGNGPWIALEQAFKDDYDINLVSFPSVPLIKMCAAAIPDVARTLLRNSYRAFRNRSLSQILPPERVSPRELEKLEYLAGPALFTSHAWIWKECIRLLAITGYRIGLGRGEPGPVYKLQEEWMTKLGFSIELN